MRKIKKLDIDKDEAGIRKDLAVYRAKILEMGASRAEIITAGEIPVDDRVILKCQIPRCFGYGTGAHCPPNTMKPSELRDILKKYKWAVFFTKEVPPEIIVRDKATIKERVAVYQDVFKIVTDIESMAFYDGHYLAFGFGAGSCRHTFCGQEDNCQALEGKKCRFSLKSRPSMEAVGIDVFRMICAAGWDIHPIGSGAKAEQIPHGILAGIIIVT